MDKDGPEVKRPKLTANSSVGRQLTLTEMFRGREDHEKLKEDKRSQKKKNDEDFDFSKDGTYFIHTLHSKRKVVFAYKARHNCFHSF